MRALALAVTLLAAHPALAAEPDPLALVGQPLPDGGRGEWAAWAREDAWEIDPGRTPERQRWVVWTRGREAVVFFVRGEEIADAVRVALAAGRSIGTVCTPAGAAHSDPAVVALVDDPPAPPGARCVFSSPTAAWRLDRERGRIVPAPAAGMRCQRTCPWD